MISSDRSLAGLPRLARLGTLADSGGFRADPRYGGASASPDPRGEELAERQRIENDAFARGFEEGRAAAMADAEAHAAREDAARARLGSALARVGSEDMERLSERLRDIALAVCTKTLAPLALDAAALNRRIAACLALLGQAEERVLYLHPDDIAFLDDDLGRDLAVTADPALERGAIRVETADGGIEDGPARWREAIAEALQSC